MNPLVGLMSQERDARAHLSALRRASAHMAEFESRLQRLAARERTRTDCIPKVPWAQVRAELAAYCPTAFWLY